MGQGVDHPKWNFTFGPPVGEEDRVGTLRVFITTTPDGKHMTSVTTCWELSDSEIEEIVRTRKVMFNSLGSGLAAHFISSESIMREFVTAYGRTWDA